MLLWNKTADDDRAAMLYTSCVGYHLEAAWKNRPERIISYWKSMLAIKFLYPTGVVLPKMPILFLYLRILIDRRTRIICFALVGIIGANWEAHLLASIFQCWPISYQWDKTIKGGRCFHQMTFCRTTSVPNIAIDLVMLILPIPMVWRLKTSRLRKLGLTIIFLVGSI